MDEYSPYAYSVPQGPAIGPKFTILVCIILFFVLQFLLHDIRITMGVIFGLLLVVFRFVYQMPWTNWLIIVVVFLLFFGVIFVYKPQIDEFGNSIKKGWLKGILKAKSEVENVPGQLAEEYEEQKAIAEGDYATVQVDQAAERELGISLSYLETDISEDDIKANDKFYVISTLTAETVEPAKVKIECYAEDYDNNITKSTKINPRDEFEIGRSAQEIIDCEFADGLPEGTYEIKMKAAFPFQSMAYLKKYVASQDSLRAITSKNRDYTATEAFEREYGIDNADPMSISATGPVGVGINFKKGPIGLSDDSRRETMGVTISNEWDGKVKELTSVLVTVPKGYSVENDGAVEMSCSQFAEKSIMRVTCEETTEIAHIYNLTGVPKSEITSSRTIRVYVKPTNIADLLGENRPYNVHNFKVNVDYEYEMSEDIVLYMEEREQI